MPAGIAAQGPWRPGTVVLASPTQIVAGFNRCEIIRGPNSSDYYEVECAQSYSRSGKKTRYLQKTSVPGKWIKANDPSFQPDMQLDAIRRAEGKPTFAVAPAPAARATAGGAARAGSYHCTFFINGMLQTVPGFTLIGARYTHQNGGGGTVRYNGNVIEFLGGPLNGQAGKVEPGVVRLYNESRSRTAIDCENKR